MALDFSRNYSPPGVYVEETDSTLVSTVGVPPTIVALVGPARGYRVNTEQIRYGTAAIRLSKRGIDASSVTVTKAAAGGEVASADFTVAKVGTASDQSYESDFAGVASPSSVDAGDVVFVSYRYTDPDYYTPQVFRNFEDVKDVYGEPLNTAAPVPGQPYEGVDSPLSLAAMVAIRNGATDLVLCAATPPPSSATTESAKSAARVTALKVAYDKIGTEPSITVVVPVTHGIGDADADTAITDLHGALALSATEGLFRFGIIGFDTTVTTAPDALLGAALSQSPHNRRLMLAYAGPGGLNMFAGGGSNSSLAVGHGYLAAAYAGRMQALPIQQSLTKRTVVGFAGLAGTPLANSLKNQYAAAGVAITEQDRFNRLTVRHGVTADTTNINTREASVVRARDGLVRALMESTSAGDLIGSPIDEDLLLSVKSNVQGVLDSAVSDDVIVGWGGLTVRQQAVDPSVVEIKFSYKPAYPLNYIVISFSIDMSNGTTDIADDLIAA